MTVKTTRRMVALVLAIGLVAAACGDSSETTTTAAPAATTAAPAETTAAPAETTAAPAETTAAPTPAATEAPDPTEAPVVESMYNLADVCPATISVQTDWFPEAEHGAMYQMVGDDYTVDGDNQITSGSLVIAGEDTGVDIAVHAGGPAIGFAPVRSYMYAEPDNVNFGYGTTDALVLGFEDQPMLALVSPLELNPQIIMWDPETYPDVETITDLRDEGVTILVFPGGSFSEIFIGNGTLNADQIDPSYSGGPAPFIAAGGTLAQQSFASAEPFLYQNLEGKGFEEWGKPIKFQTIHDAGLEMYAASFSIRTGELEELRPCLERLVPIVQQATLDYAASPDRANAIIVDAVLEINSFWVYPIELAAWSAQQQADIGLVGNGSDSIVGNFDMARVQGVIDQMAKAGMNVPAGLQASDIVTNEFIDESLGF